jgi:arylsulfatase A-like enzyme
MKLQHFSLFVLAVLAGLNCGSAAKKAAKQPELGQKPNILFIMCDDLTTQAISAYGGIYKDIAPTPNIDKLAKGGMLFQNVLCTNAICGPSRACILTGKQAHVNGFYKNEEGGQFNANQWTFPQEFRANGYATSLFGKWHLGSEPVGFDEFFYHITSAQQGLYWNPTYNHNGQKEKKTGYDTNITTDVAINWLDTRPDKSKPFMMMLQYKAPHRPWEPDTKYEKLWDEIEMPYPATFNDNYAGREKTAGDTEMTMDFFSRRDMKLQTPANLTGKDKVQWEFYGAKPGELVQPEGMSKEEGRKWRYQNYIKDYLACVKSVDDNIGRVLANLEKSGMDKNTMIVLTSDQGFYLGDHGFFDKRFIYEESLRMPFIVRYPNVVKAGTTNKEIITNVDFAPTFLAAVGIKCTEKVQGSSFASMLAGAKPKDWQDAMYYHYYEFPFWHHVQPHYGIRTQRYTLAHFYYNIDVWELYDLQKNPQQTINYINDPAYQPIIAELKQKLTELKKKAGNEKPLAEYRAITEKNFGDIMNVEKGERTQDVIQSSEKKKSER